MGTRTDYLWSSYGRHWDHRICIRLNELDQAATIKAQTYRTVRAISASVVSWVCAHLGFLLVPVRQWQNKTHCRPFFGCRTNHNSCAFWFRLLLPCEVKRTPLFIQNLRLTNLQTEAMLQSALHYRVSLSSKYLHCAILFGIPCSGECCACRLPCVWFGTYLGISLFH
jgi:hypothetical protein